MGGRKFLLSHVLRRVNNVFAGHTRLTIEENSLFRFCESKAVRQTPARLINESIHWAELVKRLKKALSLPYQPVIRVGRVTGESIKLKNGALFG
jgi:hypothetical protein